MLKWVKLVLPARETLWLIQYSFSKNITYLKFPELNIPREVNGILWDQNNINYCYSLNIGWYLLVLLPCDLYMVHTFQPSYKIGLTKLSRWRTHSFLKFTRLVISRAGNRLLVWICPQAILFHSSQPGADLSLNSLFFALCISNSKKALEVKVLKASLLKGRVNMRIDQYVGTVPGFHFPRILPRASSVQKLVFCSAPVLSTITASSPLLTPEFPSASFQLWNLTSCWLVLLCSLFWGLHSAQWSWQSISSAVPDPLPPTLEHLNSLDITSFIIDVYHLYFRIYVVIWRSLFLCLSVSLSLPLSLSFHYFSNIVSFNRRFK